MRSIKSLKIVSIVLIAISICMSFALGAAASFREGNMGAPDMNNPTADNPAAGDNVMENNPGDTPPAEDGTAGPDGVVPEDPPMTDTNTGTGSTAVDTADAVDDTASTDNVTTDNRNPVESAVDGVVDGAEDMVTNNRGGINIWGIVIAIIVIVAAAVLIFAFIPRKK